MDSFIASLIVTVLFPGVILTVPEPPVFSVRPSDREVLPGDDVNITCVALGDPIPQVKWRRGSIDIGTENNSSNVLVLQNIHSSASYTCVASSDLGSTEATIDVIVKEPYLTKFMSKEKHYLVVINRYGSQLDGESFCQTDFDGRLSRIQSDEELFHIIAELRLLNTMQMLRNDSSNEIWIGERTNKTTGMLNVTSGDLGDDRNGENCVILADRPAEDGGTTYNLYPKRCDNITSSFLCEADRVPPFRHLYLEAAGQCPENTMIISTLIYLEEDGCRALGGEVKMPLQEHNIVSCQFDVCGANSMDGNQGIVLAREGSCPGNDAYSAYLGPISHGSSECAALGGSFVGLTGSVELGNISIQIENLFPTCKLNACRKTKVANRFTVTFSGEGGNCSIEDQAGRAPLMVNSTEECAEMHGTMDTWLDSLNRCWVNLCRLTVPDCKTTQLGKAYDGQLSVTVSGKTCQRWDSSVPHNTGNQNPDWFPDDTLADAANYCRNPGDWIEGPFCYTTDPDTVWEACDMDFCEGHGPQVEDYYIGKTRYIYVPGKHNNPTEYCAKAYGAASAMIKGDLEAEHLNNWLAHLKRNSQLANFEISVGGRAPAGTATGRAYNDYANIARGKTGPCLILSNWDATSQSYNSSRFQLYTDDCPDFFESFLCEVTETRLEHYEVYGGTPQMGVHQQDACINSCQKDCLAVGYDSLEESCWHYTTDVPSPGRSKWNFLYVQKAQSVCHNYLILMDQGVVMNASSLSQDEMLNVTSADQAKVSSKTLTLEGGGVSPGAWIPASSDSRQWVQAQFSQAWMMYGLVVMGTEGIPGNTVKTFSVLTSLNPDCSDLTNYGDNKVFHGARAGASSVTIILDKAIMAHCVRILPKTWSGVIALRFDVIGCTERNNLALGSKVLPTQGENGSPSWKAVDGFALGLSSWGGCVTSSKQNYPWFAVELTHFHDVREVALYGTRECCDGELKDISVKVLATRPSSRPLGATFTRENECGYITTPLMGTRIQKVTCDPMKTGRYIQIEKNAMSSQVAVCEIKVYGFKSLLQNQAVNKEAHQVDNLRINTDASRAVDGNTNANYNHGSCSATVGASESQWWMVDLGNTYTVRTIVIYIRSEGTSVTKNLALYVGDSVEDKVLIDNSNLCATQKDSAPKGAVLEKTCATPLNGRYVKIVMAEKRAMYLCEVEVLAEPVRIKTYSGNGNGASCHFPFTYKGETHYTCIKQDKGRRFWCPTTENYDADNTWGYCIDVSLWGGRTQTEGLVLVRGATDDMTWGTVCDDGWDDTDAKVVCKLLGFQGGRAVYPPFFVSGPGSIAINNVNCNGSEDSIMSCDYQTSSSQCTHYEDAAVQCEQHDIWPSFGYPPAKRRQQDTLKEGIFVLPDNQEITVPGKIISWRFYSVKPEPKTKLTLQIWRRVYDLEGMRFLLVGAVDVSSALLDDGVVTIMDAQLINVQSGDLVGFSFVNGNPIPYDSTYNCDQHGRVVHGKNTTVPVGGITTLISKDDSHLGCRIYSLFVKIEIQAINSLHEFLYEGKFYRIITTPNSKGSADNLCKKTFGASGHVLQLDTESEYKYVRNFLQNTGLKGEFWLNNTRNEKQLGQVVGDDWAPCQPEEGKVCLMLSNKNKDQKYMWYSTSCMDQNYFICETDPPETSSVTNSEGEPVTAPSSVSKPWKKPPPKQSKTPGGQSAGKHSERRWPIVVGILVPAIIIGIAVIAVVVFLKYRRDGKKVFDYPLIFEETGGDEPMSVTSEPALGSVSLHKNNNDTLNM